MSTLLSPPRPDLGETIRELARLRGLKAYELADKVDLSATAMSQIMNNVSRPRQSTFTRLCKVLCTSKAEERRLVSAYAGAELMEDKAGAAVPLAAEVDEEGYSREADIHRLRAEQYLERKAQSIAFRASVGRALEKAGVSFRAEVCENGVAADFLVERADGTRLVLECRFNTQRDFERAIATAEVLRARLGCATAWIVVPFDGGGLAAMAAGTGVEVVALGEVEEKL